MSDNKYILATDYKCGVFSAVFSFEASEKVFKSMDKADLLHAYMVFKIIEILETDDYAENKYSRPFFMENAGNVVQKVIKSIKKRLGKDADKKFRESDKAIEDRYPLETKWIRKLVGDPDQFVAMSFFVPQILYGTAQEYEANSSKKQPSLVQVNLIQLFGGSKTNPWDISLVDMADCWRSGNVSDGQSAKLDKAKKSVFKMLKDAAQLNLAASGELAKAYAEQQSDT